MRKFSLNIWNISEMTGTHQHSLEMGPLRIWAVHGPHALCLNIVIAFLRMGPSAHLQGQEQLKLRLRTLHKRYTPQEVPAGVCLKQSLGNHRLKGFVKNIGDLGGKRLKEVHSSMLQVEWQSSVKFNRENQEESSRDHSQSWVPEGCVSELGCYNTEAVWTGCEMDF